jgi:hypothetical protein
MSYDNDAGFGRGVVLGALWDHPIEKVDPEITGASQVGRTKKFTDVNPHTGALLSNELVTVVAVRNDTGGEVKAEDKVTIDGYEGVVDEYLTKPVPEGEVFWLVIAGPTVVGGDRVRLQSAAPTEFVLPKVAPEDADADATATPDATTPDATTPDATDPDAAGVSP